MSAVSPAPVAPIDMRFPLKYQLMLPMAGVAAASLLLLAGVNALVATRQTRARVNHQLRGVLDVLANSNYPLTDPVLRQMRNLSSAEFVLTSSSGTRVAASSPIPWASLPRGPTRTIWQDQVLGRPVSLGGVRYYHASLALENRLAEGEPLVLHVLFPRTEYLAAWTTAFVPPLVIGLLAVMAVAVVAQSFARRIGRISAGLIDHVQRLAAGDFRLAELPRRHDELRELAAAVNQTADRLKDYERQLRRTEQMRTVAMLGAGLAHEIRNAATGCRIAVDLHAEGCPQGATDQSLHVARRQLEWMESRLQRFLKVGKSADEAQVSRFDLAAAVDELIPLLQPAAEHARVQLHWSRPVSPIFTSGDRDALQQAVLNVALNAIQAAQGSSLHSGASSEVAIHLDRDDANFARLTVTDTGDGPPDTVREDVFGPFVSSRPEGVGLGLAVVKQVVDAHGGTVGWERRDAKTWFSMQLPLAEGSASDEPNSDC